MQDLDYRSIHDVPLNGVLLLSKANGWAAAEGRELLHKGWRKARLFGIRHLPRPLGKPHLMVLPTYHDRDVEREITHRFRQRHNGFCQRMLVTETTAVELYER